MKLPIILATIILLSSVTHQHLYAQGELSEEQIRQLDSLYSFAYIKHRIYQSLKEFDIPKEQRRKLLVTSNIADTIVARLGNISIGRYSYLVNWVKHPEWTEAEAMGSGGGGPTSSSDCIADTTGYVTFQQQITNWRILSRRHEQMGEYSKAISYRDSIINTVAFLTNDLFRAKKMAVMSRDSAWFLKLHKYDRFRSFKEKAHSGSKWPLANTPDEKSFVRNSLRGLDTSTLGMRREPLAFRLAISRFAVLHTEASNAIFPSKSAIGAMLQPKKETLRKIYSFLIEETYTSLPAVFCKYVSFRDSLSPIAISTLNYFSLHLSQLNGFGQIYPDSLFDNYFSFLENLVYNRIYDIEAYAYYYDMYITAVKHKHSLYGIVSRKKGLDFEEEIEDLPEIRARRQAHVMLPLDQATKE